ECWIGTATFVGGALGIGLAARNRANRRGCRTDGGLARPGGRVDCRQHAGVGGETGGPSSRRLERSAAERVGLVPSGIAAAKAAARTRGIKNPRPQISPQ